MTSGSIFRVCFLCLACVGGVLGAALAAYSSSLKLPVGEEGATAEQAILSTLASTHDHIAPPLTHLAAAPLPLTHEEAPGGFERYISGLGRLSAALMNPGYDWEATGAHDTPTAPDEGRHGNTDFRSNVQKLFAFTGTMKRLSNSLKQLRFNDDGREIKGKPTSSAEAETNLPSRLHDALEVAVADLSRLYDNFWHKSGGDEDIDEEEGKAVQKDGMHVLMENFEALSRAHNNYTGAADSANSPIGGILEPSTLEVTATVHFESTPTSRIVESFTPEVGEASPRVLLDWQENQRGLLQVATQLKALLGMESGESDRNDTVHISQSSTMPFTSTTTTTTSPREPREQPCLPPFELIAYRMCILQEMQLKLSWDNAQEFCRERGAELAEDMVVIKTQRYLNDLYGEDGTRTRWPVWVGGRRAGQTWIWEGGQQVPQFLWAPSEPREFSSHLAPKGQCMILDGYRRFYGASLPCHLRRRFVCQLSS